MDLQIFTGGCHLEDKTAGRCQNPLVDVVGEIVVVIKAIDYDAGNASYRLAH